MFRALSSRPFLTFLVSLASGLLMGEIYLRWNPPHWLYFNNRNIIQQTCSEPHEDPRILYVPRDGAEQIFWNREFITRVRINRDHLRDRDYSIEKPSGVKRILALGDSHIFGWGVQIDQTVTELLENKWLQGAEVLNTGVSGYSPYQQMARLEQDGMKYQPDIILFFLSEWPTPDIDRKVYWKRGRMYWPKSPDTYSWKEKIRFSLYRVSYVYTVLERGIHFTLENFHRRKEFSKNLMAQDDSSLPSLDTGVLDQLREITRGRTRLVLVYFPIKGDWLERRGEAVKPEVERLRQYCLDYEIDFLNLAGPLKEFWLKTGKLPYFRIDDHWNRFGHEAAAEAIAGELKKWGF